MALLDILTLPDPRLHQKSLPVGDEDFGPSLKKFVIDMHETMLANQGIGLAAVQVGVHKRIIILDIGDLSSDEPYLEGDEEEERNLAIKRGASNLEVFINPVIIKGDGEIEYEEGCLSVPGVRSAVIRKEFLVIQYQDLEGDTYEMECDGLRAIALQHEIDHCDGIVFTDRLGPMQKIAVLERYKKLRQEEAEEEKV